MFVYFLSVEKGWGFESAYTQISHSNNIYNVKNQD